MSFEIEKVIIKGEIPEKCSSCPKYDRWLGYCWLMSKARDESHNLPDWCPLVTVSELFEGTMLSELYRGESE
jgi:hypothetical protein